MDLVFGLSDKARDHGILMRRFSDIVRYHGATTTRPVMTRDMPANYGVMLRGLDTSGDAGAVVGIAFHTEAQSHRG
jgi:hypothetical protein